MKKLLILVAALLIATSLVACNDNKDDKNKDTNATIDIPTEDGTSTPTEAPSSDENEDTPSDKREFEETNDKIYIFTPNGAANLRTDTSFGDSALSGISLNNGTELDRVGTDGTWSKITHEDKTYYIANSVIIAKDTVDGFEETSKTIKIKGDVFVRFAPGRTNDEPIHTLSKDQTVEVIGFNKNVGSQGWYQIKFVVVNEDDAEKNVEMTGYISAHEDYSEVVEAPKA